MLNFFKLLGMTTTILLRFTNVQAFDNTNVKGPYAFQLHGSSSDAPTVATGILIADGKGHVSGHGVFRSNGLSCDMQVTGGYAVGSNGEGTLSAITQSLTPWCVTSVLDLQLVLANGGKHIDVANNENDYMSGHLQHQGKAKFRLADLSGSYALRLQGTSSVTSAQQQETVGVAVIKPNGSGMVQGSAMLRSAGVSCYGNLTGNDQITSDGTGSINMNFLTRTAGCFNTVVDLSLALVDQNSGVVASDENDELYGTLIRQRRI